MLAPSITIFYWRLSILHSFKMKLLQLVSLQVLSVAVLATPAPIWFGADPREDASADPRFQLENPQEREKAGRKFHCTFILSSLVDFQFYR